MSFEIIDFHTHPFIESSDNICYHKEFCHMSAEGTHEIFSELGISRICGSVVSMNSNYATLWDKIKHNNDTALKLRDIYGSFYLPGFHVHPAFLEESIAEIHRMKDLGIRLIGELVPAMDGWDDYSSSEFSVLLEEAGRTGMVVSFHSMGDDAMDRMVEAHKEVVFVAAHPGEYPSLMRHIERMKHHENYYLDVSGTGLFRNGILRRIIDTIGVERILFGSDYPVCNPAMYLGGVLLDPLLTTHEKESILGGNAKKVLSLP